MGDMIKLGAAVLVASFVAGLVVTAPGVTPQVEAHTYAAKAERLEAPRAYGAACSERGWPYFETGCLRDTNSPARAVRMVGTDRVLSPR
jgi:hypothetical protein